MEMELWHAPFWNSRADVLPHTQESNEITSLFISLVVDLPSAFLLCGQLGLRGL